MNFSFFIFVVGTSAFPAAAAAKAVRGKSAWAWLLVPLVIAWVIFAVVAQYHDSLPYAYALVFLPSLAGYFFAPTVPGPSDAKNVISVSVIAAALILAIAFAVVNRYQTVQDPLLKRIKVFDRWEGKFL